MKKILSVILCLSLMLCFAACKSKQSQSAETVEQAPTAVSAQDFTAAAGSSTLMNVELTGAEKLAEYGNGTIAGIQFEMKYDPAVISLSDAKLTIEQVAQITNTFTLDFGDDKNGSAMVMILDDNLQGIMAETLPLFSVNVQVAANAPAGSTDIEFEMIDICDSNADSKMLEAVENGTTKITIE